MHTHHVWTWQVPLSHEATCVLLWISHKSVQRASHRGFDWMWGSPSLLCHRPHGTGFIKPQTPLHFGGRGLSPHPQRTLVPAPSYLCSVSTPLRGCSYEVAEEVMGRSHYRRASHQDDVVLGGSWSPEAWAQTGGLWLEWGHLLVLTPANQTSRIKLLWWVPLLLTSPRTWAQMLTYSNLSLQEQGMAWRELGL